MKITIDTKEESVEEMQKLIRMLQNIVEGKVGYSTVYENQEPSSQTVVPATSNQSPLPDMPGSNEGLFNLFNDDPKPDPEVKDDDSETINMETPEEEDKEIPTIIPYE